MSASVPECLVVIPARGGSKGLPRKNILSVAGKPLLVHAIDAALGASRVTRLVVSTDDAEIAAVSAAAGAEVIERPTELSGDRASSESAVVHALNQLAERDGYRPEYVMLMQCTTPMTRSEDLDGAIRQLEQSGADSCFTAVPFSHFLWQEDVSGEAVGINHSGQKRVRRQDLSPQALENGAAYVMRTEPFLKTSERFCGRTVVHRVPSDRALEVDTAIELEIAEVLLRARAQEAAWDALPTPVGALVLDFDGVLTDNSVYVSETGQETVRCDRGDGMGIAALKAAGVPVMILSKERNQVVQRRAEKLGVECYNAIDDKHSAIHAWSRDRGIALSQVVYVGNDINDLGAMSVVGCAACPRDAHQAVHASAALILPKRGGRGAVRVLCDAILQRRDQSPSAS